MTQKPPARSTLQIFINSRFSEREEDSYVPDIDEALSCWDEDNPEDDNAADNYQDLINALVEQDVATNAPTSVSVFIKLMRMSGIASARLSQSGRWAASGEPWSDIPSAPWQERAMAFLLWRATDLDKKSLRGVGGSPQALTYRMAALGYTRLAKTMMISYPEILQPPKRENHSIPSLVEAAFRWNDLELLKTLLEHKFSYLSEEGLKFRSEEALVLLLEHGYEITEDDILNGLFEHISKKQAASVVDILLKNSGLSPEKGMEASFSLMNLDITMAYAAKMPAGISHRYVKNSWSASAPTFMLTSPRSMESSSLAPWIKKSVKLASSVSTKTMLAPGISERAFLEVVLHNFLSLMDKDDKKLWAAQLSGLTPKPVSSKMLAPLIPLALSAGPSPLRTLWAREMLVGYVRSQRKNIKNGILDPQSFSILAALAKMSYSLDLSKDQENNWHMSPRFDFEKIKWVRPSSGNPNPEDALWVLMLQINNIGIDDENQRPPAGIVRQVQGLVLPDNDYDKTILNMALKHEIWDDTDIHSDWLKLRNSLRASLNEQRMDRAVSHAKPSPIAARQRL
jgi:hypothetical protein